MTSLTLGVYRAGEEQWKIYSEPAKILHGRTETDCLRVVLEFQYPLHYVFLAVHWEEGDEYRSNTAKFPDDKIFLKKIGIYRNLSKDPLHFIGPASEVRWFSPNEVLKTDGRFDLNKIGEAK